MLGVTPRLCLFVAIHAVIFVFGSPVDITTPEVCHHCTDDTRTHSDDGSPQNQIQPDGFPRGKHSLGDPCDHTAWMNFHKDRNSLLEIILSADPAADKDELNQLLSEGQERIISKNYSNICFFHQFLECSVDNVCVCVAQAPPFNFELNDSECRGKRGALCDSDGDGIGHFECLPGLHCEMALPGNTAICGGKQAFEEELEKSKKNSGHSIFSIGFLVTLASVYSIKALTS